MAPPSVAAPYAPVGAASQAALQATTHASAQAAAMAEMGQMARAVNGLVGTAEKTLQLNQHAEMQRRTSAQAMANLSATFSRWQEQAQRYIEMSIAAHGEQTRRDLAEWKARALVDRSIDRGRARRGAPPRESVDESVDGALRADAGEDASKSAGADDDAARRGSTSTLTSCAPRRAARVLLGSPGGGAASAPAARACCGGRARPNRHAIARAAQV